MRFKRLLAVLTLPLLLCACADFTVIAASPTPAPGTFVPPATGFNHRFGNTPLSSKDGFALERAVYSQHVYWEVALRIDPERLGYTKLSDATAVKAARHAVTSLALIIATEDGHTIVGLLAEGSDAGQQRYAIQLLDRLRAYGYDNLASAQVIIFFTESDEHAVLDWHRGNGYTFTVRDGDLKGTALRPLPSTTPLPAPASL